MTAKNIQGSFRGARIVISGLKLITRLDMKLQTLIPIEGVPGYLLFGLLGHRTTQQERPHSQDL